MADRVRRVLPLAALSALGAGALELAGLPAAFLLGPMIAAIIVAARGGAVTLAPDLSRGAQAVIGCLIGASITPPLVARVVSEPWLFVGTTAATLAASTLIGWLLTRWQVLPGTVAMWGAMPGAATALVLMAPSYGADARLVAVMAYLRVVLVASLASVLAALLTGHSGGHPPGGTAWLAPPDPARLAATLGVAAAGWALATRLRVPAPALIGPLALAAALNVTGLLRPELPALLLAAAYVLVGWRIGMGFTPDILRSAARALPRLVLATVTLIAFCGAMAVALARLAHVDLVTAYLATSPGGADSVAVIAASSPVDASFVMAMQVLRLVAVLLLGPLIARAVAARHLSRHDAD